MHPNAASEARNPALRFALLPHVIVLAAVRIPHPTSHARESLIWKIVPVPKPVVRACMACMTNAETLYPPIIPCHGLTTSVTQHTSRLERDAEKSRTCSSNHDRVKDFAAFSKQSCAFDCSLLTVSEILVTWHPCKVQRGYQGMKAP
jgi:hypothetical protein